MLGGRPQRQRQRRVAASPAQAQAVATPRPEHAQVGLRLAKDAHPGSRTVWVWVGGRVRRDLAAPGWPWDPGRREPGGPSVPRRTEGRPRTPAAHSRRTAGAARDPRESPAHHAGAEGVPALRARRAMWSLVEHVRRRREGRGRGAGCGHPRVDWTLCARPAARGARPRGGSSGSATMCMPRTLVGTDSTSAGRPRWRTGLVRPLPARLARRGPEPPVPPGDRRRRRRTRHTGRGTPHRPGPPVGHRHPAAGRRPARVHRRRSPVRRPPVPVARRPARVHRRRRPEPGPHPARAPPAGAGRIKARRPGAPAHGAVRRPRRSPA